MLSTDMGANYPFSPSRGVTEITVTVPADAFRVAVLRQAWCGYPAGLSAGSHAPPMMWRMLNAEAVIFMGWNAGTDRRLDRLRTIAAALAGGLGLEAAHENHRG
jgi:hypothetical protein